PEPRVAPAPKPEAVVPPMPSTPEAGGLLVTDTEHWLSLVARSSLRGPVRLLAEHAAFVAHHDGVLRLSLAPGDEHLKSPSLVLQLGDALASMLGGGVQLHFETGEPRGDTARVRHARERESRQAQAEQGFAADPHIQRLVEVHGARILPDTIRPLGEN
ncbi:MAG: DNA polymerase III subunit gamma/tau, partial [Xanthomonadales bacterium]|nr:DNA polymerase III subunit gamma/tau [Xanthomonadales bacterium]